MRSIKKYQNGGKQEENPFPDGITQDNIVSLLDDYYDEIDRLFDINYNKGLDINPFDVTPYPFDYMTDSELESFIGDYLSDDAEKLEAFKKGMQSYKSGDYRKGVPYTESGYDAFLRAFGQSFEEIQKVLGHGNHPIFPDELNRGADDLRNTIRNRFARYQFAPEFIPIKHLGIGEPYQGQDKLPLQSSSISLPKTRKAELIYKPSRKTRTGQEPNYYKYWDSDKKKWKRRPVEPEEYDRYMRENRIRKRIDLGSASFSKGGKVKVIKKYQNGGKEPEVEKPAEGTMMGDLLRMLEQYKQPKTTSEYGTYTTNNPYDNPEFMDFAEKYDLYDEGYQDRAQKHFDMLYNHFGRDRIVNLLEEQIESNRPYYDLSALSGFSKSNPIPGPLPDRAEGKFTLTRHFRELAFSKNSGHPLRKEYERIQAENPDRDWSQIQDEIFKDYNPTSREIAEFIVSHRGSYKPSYVDEHDRTSVHGDVEGKFHHFSDAIEIAKYNPNLLDNFIHELQHGMDNPRGGVIGDVISSVGLNIMEEEKQRLKNDPENKNYSKYYHGNGFARSFHYYVSQPNETNARIQVLRRHLSEVGVNIFEEDVTLEDLEKLKVSSAESLGVDRGTESGSTPLDDLRVVYTDEGIVRMLNNIFKKGGRIKTIKKRKPGMKIKKFKR